MSLETWKSIADWASIILVALTVASGSAALILGGRINQKQDEQLREFNAKLTEAKTGLSKQEERAANAERDLAGVKEELSKAKTREAEAEKRLEEVQKKQAPRWISTDKFAIAFGKAHPGKAFIQYQTGNEEIALFASSVAPALVATGWHLMESPRPVPSAHPTSVIAAMYEVFLYENFFEAGDPSDPLSPIGGLNKAFTECGFKPAIFSDNSLPKDTVRIVIGPKI